MQSGVMEVIMADKELWSSGIEIAWVGDRWDVSLTFHGVPEAFDTTAIDGGLSLRYLQYSRELSLGVQMLRAAADRIGVVFKNPTLYVEFHQDTKLPDGYEAIVQGLAAENQFALLIDDLPVTIIRR